MTDVTEEPKLADWQLSEYEAVLDKATGIKLILDNPPEDLLHRDYVAYQKQYNALVTEKVRFYRGLKHIVSDLHKIQLLKLETGKIVYFKGEYSEANYPQLYYFSPFEIPFMAITTNIGRGFEVISSKDFVHSLMNGIGFDKR